METLPREALEPASPAASACSDWFSQLDAALDRAGVRDASAYRIPGFPYLRVDRFLASFRNELKPNEPAFNAWAGHLARLDAEARGYELKNLPQRALPILGVNDKESASTETQTCAARLAREDLASAAKRNLLIGRAAVPDDYADWKRVLGIYPLTRVPFLKGIEAWQDETVELFKKARIALAPEHAIARYRPASPAHSADRVAMLFAHLKKDALGIPELDAKDRETLFEAYAPEYEIETTGRDDHFGPLSWNGNPSPEVGVTGPVAYTRLALTRYHGQNLVQLVYTIWFPQRPANRTFDMLSGKLDGVVFRVTLGSDGAPLIYDSIHACGCYHLFFPTARMQLLPAPDPRIEWAFVPVALPAMQPAQRVVVRIAGRTHYVVDVQAQAAANGAARYRLADDDELRAMPLAAGVTRSAFGPDGIVPGTERGERLFYWPMGIDSPGAMRQWGRHATAFVGRRHFDDAHLIEERFAPAAGTQAGFEK